MNFIFLLATCCFVGSLSFRLIDPVVPDIARDLAVAPEAVALLSTAFSLSYAASQPFVGAISDAIGKVRVIKICIVALASMLLLMALAPSLEWMYASRIIGGIFGGGVFTVALSIVGDRVALERRQEALSNLIMASQSAQLFGIIACGYVAHAFGWRMAVGISALAAALAFLLLNKNLKPRPDAVRHPFNLTRMRTSFSTLLRNPKASTCYAGVFLDGLAVTGCIPFIAILMEQRGQGGLTEASLVIAGFGLGGLMYGFLVRYLLALTGGMLNMLRFGGVLCALGLAGVAHGGPWQLQMAEFMLVGCGFFMLHASLQAQATDVPQELRTTSVSLHSTAFCLGSAFGPALYAVGINTIGGRSSILIGAFVILAIGLFTAARFEGLWYDHQPAPAE